MLLQKFKIFNRKIFTSGFSKRRFWKTTLYLRKYDQTPISVFAYLIWIMEFPFKSVEFDPPCTGCFFLGAIIGYLGNCKYIKNLMKVSRALFLNSNGENKLRLSRSVLEFCHFLKYPIFYLLKQLQQN